MIKSLPLTLLFFFSLALSAQKKEKQDPHLLSDRAEWFEGTILLTNGTQLEGLVKYNDRNGVLSYENGGESKVFTPLRISGFEFFDESYQKQRVFYTLDYEDSQTGVERPQFFEVLRDYQTFAVLSKMDRIDLNEKIVTNSSYYNLGSSTRTKVTISQTETIYLMNSDGEIRPYLEIVNSEDGEKSMLTGKDVKTKNKMVDEDLLLDYLTEPVYRQLEYFANTNELKFKKKADLLKILEYYDTIR